MQQHSSPAKTRRLAEVTLDSQSLASSTPELEIERHKAISDLLHENSFALATRAEAAGPYHLTLSLQEERLILRVICTATGHREEIAIHMGPFRKHIQDYKLLCDGFYKMAQAGEIHKLEALDAGRRSVHNESAEMLMETLENKITLDKGTARRLFTLMYVLHMRGSGNIPG